MNKINFKQPKYILPAIIYLPLVATGYFVIDMFGTEIKSVNKNLAETEYLNPELPEARIKDGIGSKRDNMVSAFGDVKDYSAVETAEGDSVKGKEKYETRYNEAEAAAIQKKEEELERLRKMQQRASDKDADSGQKATAVNNTQSPNGRNNTGGKSATTNTGMGKDDFTLPISDEELEKAKKLRAQAKEQGKELISKARSRSRDLMNGVYGEDAEYTDEETDNDKDASAKDKNGKGESEGKSAMEKAESVIKRKNIDSEYFNTLSENETENTLVKAIIDEGIKASEGSRVRLRLLDDVEIGGRQVNKGTYLYATLSGFGKQRVKGTVSSVFTGGEIVNIDLSIYDTDGIEGLYVPQSSFRETAKEVGSSAMQQTMSMNGSSSQSSMTQWATQAAQQAYQRTTQAISKAIKKNKVRLKYGTQVYLVNRDQLKDSKKIKTEK